MHTHLSLALILLCSCGRTDLVPGRGGAAGTAGGQNAGRPSETTVAPQAGDTAGRMADLCDWSTPGKSDRPAASIAVLGKAEARSLRVRVVIDPSAYAHKGYVSKPSLSVIGPRSDRGMDLDAYSGGDAQGEYFFDLRWVSPLTPREGMKITLTVTFSFACAPQNSSTFDATTTAELVLCRGDGGGLVWRGPGEICELWNDPSASDSGAADSQLIWVQVNVVAGFPARADHVALAFKDKVWVLGGTGSYGTDRNDVWSSSDGNRWSQGSAAAWSPRSLHRGVVFQDRMWVIDGVRKSDVWSSGDGAVWTKVVEPAAFPPRYAGQVVVFADKMWIIGGYGALGKALADVWSSPNGKDWTQVLSSAPWGARDLHACVVANGKIWLVDGERQGDVWSSSDGNHWEQVPQTAGFPGRMGHSSVFYQGKLWILGGYGKAGKAIDDVWMSADGAAWDQQAVHAPWGPRQSATALVFQDKTWLIGGSSDDTAFGDVWTLAPE